MNVWNVNILIMSWKHRSRGLTNKSFIFIVLSKQGNSCTKASGSPGAKFSRNFLIWWGTSMQWRPLIPKEGGLIQMDIGGHPPFSTSSKQFSCNFGNLLFLGVFNFRGHFEGLNEGLLGLIFSMIIIGMNKPQKWISLMIPFQRAIMHLKHRSYAKVTTLGS